MLMPPGNPTAPPHRPRLVADGGTPGSARGSGLAGTHHVRSGRQSSLGDRCTCRFWGHRLPPAHTCTHGHSWGQSGPVDRLPGGNGRVAVPGWTRPSAMSGRGRTGGVPSAWPQGRRLPVPRLPADSAGGQARSAAMVTHWGPTPPPSAQPAPQTGGKSPHDSGEGRALSRVPAGLRTAEHPPLMGGTEEGVQHTAGAPGLRDPRLSPAQGRRVGRPGGAGGGRLPSPGHSLRLQSGPRSPAGQWQAPVTGSQEPPLRHRHSCSQPGPKRPGGHPAGNGRLPGPGFPSTGPAITRPLPYGTAPRTAGRAALTPLAAGAVVAGSARAGARGRVASLVPAGTPAFLPAALPKGAGRAGWGAGGGVSPSPGRARASPSTRPGPSWLRRSSGGRVA